MTTSVTDHLAQAVQRAGAAKAECADMPAWQANGRQAVEDLAEATTHLAIAIRQLEPNEPSPTDSPLSLMKRAIRLQLLELIGSDAEITPARLGVIQRFCASQQQALIAVEAPSALARGSVGRITMPDGSTFSPGDGNVIGTPIGTFPLVGEPLAPAPPAETYGVNALRNMMDSFQNVYQKITNKPPSATDLIQAIASAREEGLDDMADQLRAKFDELYPPASTPIDTSADEEATCPTCDDGDCAVHPRVHSTAEPAT